MSGCIDVSPEMFGKRNFPGEVAGFVDCSDILGLKNGFRGWFVVRSIRSQFVGKIGYPGEACGAKRGSVVLSEQEDRQRKHGSDNKCFNLHQL